VDFLELRQTFQDPELRDLEIVERKGIGHPDTLADALAEIVSMAYSRYCLHRFGAVLHHNVDKLYIGAGHFKIGFGFCEMLKPVQVRINGRMSNSFAGEEFDIEEIQRFAVIPYLLSVLPHLKAEQIVVSPNATQYTKVPHWFSPRGIEDLPNFSEQKANDTSVCISHWPMTTSERLAYEIERFFWVEKNGFPHPRFDHYGQDIKVMVCRKDHTIDVTVCLPVISTSISSFGEYDTYIEEAKLALNNLAEKIVSGTKYSVFVKVNPYQRLYMLGTGSCIECGEEGLVGRGNANSGVISIFRPHSMEAWSGKNPVYHTGRVLSLLTINLAKAINRVLGAKCTVMAMTKNGHSLVPPFLLSIETDIGLDERRVRGVIDDHFMGVDYLETLLAERQLR